MIFKLKTNLKMPTWIVKKENNQKLEFNHMNSLCDYYNCCPQAIYYRLTKGIGKKSHIFGKDTIVKISSPSGKILEKPKILIEDKNEPIQ